jgi:hypothetical protein
MLHLHAGAGILRNKTVGDDNTAIGGVSQVLGQAAAAGGRSDDGPTSNLPRVRIILCTLDSSGCSSSFLAVPDRRARVIEKVALSSSGPSTLTRMKMSSKT